MKKLIVANWKMNPQTYKEAEDLVNKILKGAENFVAEVVLCPPFTWLTDFSHKNNSQVLFGAQNVYFEENGAFTGEVSPEMLRDLGVEYVIIGHSERRKYFGETDETVNKKIKKSLRAGLKVIFCIGETAEERDAGKKNEVLERQIKKGLDDIDNLENINIAYEPIWAIGTGNNCSVEETKESVDFIRGFVKPETRILYGGSVKSSNSADYMEKAGANGLLVGGASLDPEEFIKIIQSVR